MPLSDTVANQRGKVSRDRKFSKLIGCSAACVHFFNCKNKENVLRELSDFKSERVYTQFLTF